MSSKKKAGNSNRSRQGAGDSTTFAKQDIAPFTCSCITIQRGSINLQFTVNYSFDVMQKQMRVRLRHERSCFRKPIYFLISKNVTMARNPLESNGFFRLPKFN
ncbi:hypothetical protein TNCV_3234631 [Trichonephila clavipes]|nr:hypothetical protein TNCV_3234631 [Trichonephila clavipes]